MQNFDSETIVQSNRPIDLKVENTWITNGKTRVAPFQGSGGTWTFQFVEVDAFESSHLLLATHEVSVFYLGNVSVKASRIRDIFVGSNGTTIAAMNVGVQSMQYMANIFNIQGAGSLLILQDLVVQNNAIDSVWTIVSVQESATATVERVTAVQNDNVRHVFRADSATMDISQAIVSDMVGGGAVVSFSLNRYHLSMAERIKLNAYCFPCLQDPADVSAVVISNAGSDVTVNELTAKGISNFTVSLKKPGYR